MSSWLTTNTPVTPVNRHSSNYEVRLRFGNVRELFGQSDGYSKPNDPMYTLQLSAQHGVCLPSAVRRLTPIECERLQGFQDDGERNNAKLGREYGVSTNAIRQIVNRIKWKHVALPTS